MTVYKYTVCWRKPSDFPWEWKHKDFACKKDAKLFAKKQKKDILLNTSVKRQPKPYIIRTLTTNTYFKEGIKVEPVKSNIVSYDEALYGKIIKY